MSKRNKTAPMTSAMPEASPKDDAAELQAPQETPPVEEVTSVDVPEMHSDDLEEWNETSREEEAAEAVQEAINLSLTEDKVTQKQIDASLAKLRQYERGNSHLAGWLKIRKKDAAKPWI